MLIVEKDINFYGKTKGMDSYEKCNDKQHFKNYKKEITYQYNSRGFRDREWPADLTDAVWCVGDSFTVGLGQPYTETWPYLLETKLKKRCINLGEDGCSNDTICLRVEEIVKNYKPSLIVVMWSYFHRRREQGKNVQYNTNDFGDEKDLQNFIVNYKQVNKLPTQIINLLIPNAFISKEEILKYCFKKNKIEDVYMIEQVDYARDYQHFDIETSKKITDMVIKKFDNSLENTL